MSTLCSCGCGLRIRRRNKKNRPAFAPGHSWQNRVKNVTEKPRKYPRVVVEEMKFAASAALEEMEYEQQH